VENIAAMTTITINEHTEKGKSLIEFLRKFEGENFIKIGKDPNRESIPALDKSLKEAKEGKVNKYSSVDELFKKLG
jgi:hypothetical protein